MYQINKICNFYVSKWHLILKILPYIKRKIEKNCEIIIYTENELYEEIKIIMNKINIHKKEDILNINWNILNIDNDLENNIRKKLNLNNNNFDIKNYKKKIIFINGSIEYIEIINKKILEIIKLQEKNKVFVINDLEIIDCYKINDDINNFSEINNYYKKRLETFGICENKLNRILIKN